MFIKYYFYGGRLHKWFKPNKTGSFARVNEGGLRLRLKQTELDAVFGNLLILIEHIQSALISLAYATQPLLLTRFRRMGIARVT